MQHVLYRVVQVSKLQERLKSQDAWDDSKHGTSSEIAAAEPGAAYAALLAALPALLQQHAGTLGKQSAEVMH